MRTQKNHAATLRPARQIGLVALLAGLSGSGKRRLASQWQLRMTKADLQVCLLDGDEIRRHLCACLGFTEKDRKENIRRVAEVARLMAEIGVICIVALISPCQFDWQLARSRVTAGQFVEIFVNAPLEVCEQRDPKGHYARARAGKLKQFTGISSPYEAPKNPAIELHADQLAANKFRGGKSALFGGQTRTDAEGEGLHYWSN